MSDNAADFLAANMISPVVYGAVVGRGGEGCRYRLADGREFHLTRDECAEVGQPIWASPTPR